MAGVTSGSTPTVRKALKALKQKIDLDSVAVDRLIDCEAKFIHSYHKNLAHTINPFVFTH